MLFQRLAFHSGNQIYGLIFNGVRKLYDRVGSYHLTRSSSFSHGSVPSEYIAERQKAESENLLTCDSCNYGIASAQIWNDEDNVTDNHWRLLPSLS